ncbi:MAG: DUF3592 domain-containing protein [bacterium]
MPDDTESVRPWFTSSLLPVAICITGATLLFLDGLHPFQTYFRRRSWKRVKGRLAQSMERRKAVRYSPAGETPVEYLARRPQRRLFKKVVTRGWLLKRKKIVWQVRLTYSFRWKKGRITRVSDTAPLDFDTQPEAGAYLAKRLKQSTVMVWVNPKNPGESTVFLDYRNLLWVRIGFALVFGGLLWFILALVLRSAHARKEADRT